jgi:glutamate-ammonia-ligase adenylyltransferase
LNAFEQYDSGEAETWEFLALTRARVIWASSEDFAELATKAVETALRRRRDRKKTAADVRDMRDLMRRERPPSGPWDLKLVDGGLVDIEFAVQYLQIVGAARRGPLHANTAAALAALTQRRAAPSEDLAALAKGWALQQDLSQVLKVALADGDDPEAEPARFQSILAKAAGVRTFVALRTALAEAQTRAHSAYERVVAP